MVRTLSKGGTRLISAAVDHLFDRIKGTMLGPDFISSRGDKRIFISHKPSLSLPGIYRQAAAEELTRPNETALHGLVKIAEGYLDAQRELTKARVLHAVNAWVAKDGKADVETVLGGELAPIWKQMSDAVTRIVDTEGTTARNMGTLEGITKISSLAGVDDPYVFFVTVRDDNLCKECKRLHLMPDGKTPRVYRMSEVSGGYHERGDDSPCIGGLHPHCRCTIANLLPGYGFDEHGRVRYVAPGHNLYTSQREE